MRLTILMTAILAIGTVARAQRASAPTPTATPGMIRQTRVRSPGGLPASVTAGALTMTGLGGTPATKLPASVTTGGLSMTGLEGSTAGKLPPAVTSGALTMTGLLGGKTGALPASVTTSHILMTGVSK